MLFCGVGILCHGTMHSAEGNKINCYQWEQLQPRKWFGAQAGEFCAIDEKVLVFVLEKHKDAAVCTKETMWAEVL